MTARIDAHCHYWTLARRDSVGLTVELARVFERLELTGRVARFYGLEAVQ